MTIFIIGRIKLSISKEKMNGLSLSKRKYVIVSPKVYAGGPIALHELCRELRRQGYDSKIFYICNYKYEKNVYWKEWFRFTIEDLRKSFKEKKDNNDSLGGCKRKILPFVTKNTIVIYPEMVYGNILKSKNNVRWLLSYYKYTNDPNAYEKNDLFVCYRLQFNEELLNPKHLILRTSYFNFDLYKKTNYGHRSGKCYVIYKGRNRKDLPEKFDGIVVDNLTERDKVKVFNECEYCYCYDLQSAYASIAALCGCITIKVLESGKNIESYIKEDDERPCGVAFGSEEKEIEYAKKTLHKIRDQLEGNMMKSADSVSNFVRICDDYFEVE